MATKQASDVDVWLGRETDHVRKALENASRHFDSNDNLTVNTLEAVYGQESSFGTRMRTRGANVAAGHFHFEIPTARRYGLNVSTKNDQRFDVDYASSAAARYLKGLDNTFSRKTNLGKGRETIPIKNVSERKKFVLGAYNGGEGRIADAQHLAEKAGKNSQVWTDVEKFLEAAGATKNKANEIRQYVERVPILESEFEAESPADKSMKQKEPRKEKYRCSEGHWVTIDDRPVFICD